MVIQIFVLLYCSVMLSSSCANCSALSVSNYNMHSEWPVKKKGKACNFSRDFKIGTHLGSKHVMNSSHVKIF